MIIFLEMNQTELPENDTVGLTVRLPVESKEAALALRDELATRFFAGVAYTSQLHTHNTDAPCEVEPL